MAQAAGKFSGAVPAAAAIDRVHFASLTFGDRALEREVLELFDLQAELLLMRIPGAPPQAMATLAHTLKGSARGVGAWGVARAAEAVERAAGAAGSEAERALAAKELARAVEEARAEIAALLLERA